MNIYSNEQVEKFEYIMADELQNVTAIDCETGDQIKLNAIEVPLNSKLCDGCYFYDYNICPLNCSAEEDIYLEDKTKLLGDEIIWQKADQ